MALLLIVDNDERIVELSAWFLRRLGHEVETANSYAEARLRLSKRWPDLLLADLDLGHERGQEELPKLAREGALPATLVISGYLDADLDAELLRIPGVLRTVAKPVDLHHLEGLIRTCLESGRLVPRPRPVQPQAPVPVVMDENLDEDMDEDGWVEIVPLAPGVEPLPGPSGSWNKRPKGQASQVVSQDQPRSGGQDPRLMP
jgi:DNA-binding response OmpR family regulator